MALICVMSSYSYFNIFPASAFWIVQKCPNLRLNSRRIEATFVWASDLSRWCVHRRLKYARYSNISLIFKLGHVSITYLPFESRLCAHLFRVPPLRNVRGTSGHIIVAYIHFAAPGNCTKVRDSGTNVWQFEEIIACNNFAWNILTVHYLVLVFWRV